MKDPLQGPVSRPLLEIAVARLIGRVAIGQIRPLRSGAQNPERPVENLPPVLARSAATILAPPILWQQRFDELPLGIREIHGVIPRARGPVITGSSPKQAVRV